MAIIKPVLNNREYEIYDIIHETPDVDVFKLKDEDGTRLDFNPGMFVMLTYTDPNTNTSITRAFSIASAPKSDILEFYIHMIHGRFTSKIEDMRIGDKLKVSGPHGQFKFVPNDDKKVLFIAGGTGLAPMMSMLREINNNTTDTDVVLIYSVRFPDEIIAKDELNDISKKINLKISITVTRQSDEEWSGERGHIDSDMIKRECVDYSERTVYICGPLNFVKAMKLATSSLDIKPIKVKADVWG